MPPAQKPGKSVQEVGTPDEFIKAVEKRFGKIDIDLAGDPNLHVVDKWYGPGTTIPDSLAVAWSDFRFGFLNPPFGKIGPWVEHTLQQVCNNPIQVGVLLPAATETNWFLNYVYGRALTLVLRPRLTFKNHTNVFPKGLMFCLYGPYIVPGIKIWDWKEDVVY